MRRVALLAIALALVGCMGTSAGMNKVRAVNETDQPSSISIVVTDTTTRSVEFSHGFQVVQPGQALEVEHGFRATRTYLVNASAFGGGETPWYVDGERRVDIPVGGALEAHLRPDRTLDILVLVTQ